MTGYQESISARVFMVVNANLILQFAPILQKGFLLEAKLGVNMRDVLCKQFGVDPDYLDSRINTIFLDGMPVDDVDSAILREGSVLALSASMPGFVGAALRKGGFYAAMRGDITHAKEKEAYDVGRGFFVLKLYNLLILEMGPTFLHRAIVLEASDLKQFFGSRPSAFWSSCEAIEFNDRQVYSSYFHTAEWLGLDGLVALQVRERS